MAIKNFSSRVLMTVALATAACAPQSPNADNGSQALVGAWRAILESPGGELPFGLVVSEDPSARGGLRAVVVNGDERAPLSSVTMERDRVTLDFDFYDSTISALIDTAAGELTGHWRKVVPEGSSVLPFRAWRIAPGARRLRFAPPEPSRTPAPFDGIWAVEFTDDSGTQPARGEFVQRGAHLTGTFLTPTGDYRFLEGSVFGNELRLSAFDGAHAFLFHATRRPDGTLHGDFWSRDTYHATWSARLLEAGLEILPDSWSLAGLTNDAGRFAFEFPDLEGRPVSLGDARFDGKVVLVNIFGSWCPNCNDEAPLLADWDRRFRDRGLAIVGLAYEFTGDRERDARQVRRYAARHAIEFPLLLAGVSDKALAGATLPDLSSVIAYPTSVFIGRDRRVRRIHTGFAGPGTGEHFRRLVVEHEQLLEELLAEQPGGAGPAAVARKGIRPTGSNLRSSGP